jgi:flavin-dependent dehydrogenase
MGVWDRLLETGTPTYRRAYVQFEEAVIDGIFPEVEGETDCLCIRRTHLDHILFEHAKAQEGVTAIEGFRVTDLIWNNETVTGVIGRHRDGVEEQFTSKLVVGADGRNSTVRNLVPSERKMCVPTDFASYVAYFADYHQEGERCVELYKVKDTIAIVFPTSDNLFVVGLMFPLSSKEWIERFKAHPETGFRDLVNAGLSGTPLPQRLQGASLADSIRGLHGYDNDWYDGMGKGWALVGDALSFKDPSVGQGMHDAIYGSRILTDVLSASGDWETGWEIMSALYQSTLESKMMSRFGLACQFTKNVPFTAEQTAVNSLIGGNADATSAFLGIYNYANEPEDLETTVVRILQGGNG